MLFLFTKDFNYLSPKKHVSFSANINFGPLYNFLIRYNYEIK